MISPKLEQLIWEGKAFFKTFVIGPHKSTMNIDNDRFIIITDINFQGFSENVLGLPANLQLSIYGEKGFNHYVFRTSINQQVPTYDGSGVVLQTGYSMTPAQTINTYLLHTTQVGFSFIKGGNLTYTTAIAADTNPSYPPPLDYGKLGDVGAIPVAVQGQIGTMNNFYTNRAAFDLPDNTLATQQLQYEASAGTLPVVAFNAFTPYANINYIEILGQPENMMF